MSQQPNELGKLLIERECGRLVNRFALLNDFGDHDGVADLFTADGSFERPIAPGQPIVGREAIRSMLRARAPRLSRHIISNIVIDVLSDTKAQGLSYVTFVSTTNVTGALPVDAEPHIFVGEYADEFVKSPEGWRFAVRRGRMTLRVVTGGPG
jgi:hypothetical protein